jgi:GNAT superfamily N-acetyltransferase
VESLAVSLEASRDRFLISTDSDRLDIDAIHAYLTRSYWAGGISRDLVARSIAGSLCFGLYADNAQIGFARVITDRATFAYLADVYVLEAYRGFGLAKWLISVVVAHPDLQGLRRFMLATRDAHGLYEQYGFRTVESPRWLMEIVRVNPYSGA